MGMDGLARRSTPGFLFPVRLAPNRSYAPPGAEGFRASRRELGSLTTEGSWHFTTSALQADVEPRGVEVVNRKICSSSVLWKGELALTRSIQSQMTKLCKSVRHEPLRLFVRKNEDVLGEFFGQATKGVRWMPWRQQTTKDVTSCDKPRGAANTL